MTRDEVVTQMADLLMTGPRGRRLLLEFARVSESLDQPEYLDGSFSAALIYASYDLDPGKGRSVAILGGTRPIPVVTPAEVAALLRAAQPADVTAALLRHCTAVAVDVARYWQEPDGSDVLANTPEMRAALWPIARHVAASEFTDWWSTPVDVRTQCTVDWAGTPPQPAPFDPASVLHEARERQMTEEVRARRDRLDDPSAMYSGTWWSNPPSALLASTRRTFDHSPAGLWFVEDSMGWESAAVHAMEVAAAPRVFEIDCAGAWAELCARFPLEVTAHKRHDWYRTTGRDGRWVVPDWVQVAEHFDAVHLQTLAYLGAAGTAINVGDDAASVIAGWNPDETYWFTPNVRSVGEPSVWRLDSHEGQDEWVIADNTPENTRNP